MSLPPGCIAFLTARLLTYQPPGADPSFLKTFTSRTKGGTFQLLRVLHAALLRFFSLACNMGPAVNSLDEMIMEMMRLNKSLPTRPSLEELEFALAESNKADMILASRLEQLTTQERPEGVLPAVFDAFQEMRKDVFEQQAREQKRAAEAVIKLEERHRRYDSLIQKAYSAVTTPLNSSYKHSDGNTHTNISSAISQHSDVRGSDANEKRTASVDPEGVNPVLPFTNLSVGAVQPSTKLQTRERFASLSGADDTVILTRSSSSSGGAIPINIYQKISIPSPEEFLTSLVGGIQNSTKVLNILDMAAKSELKTLDLHGVFLTELDRIPESIGRLTWLTELNLSGNRLTTLPESIGQLQSLSLLDVSANQLISLPESLGYLTSLMTLNIEKNKIEELPCTIGQCAALVELHADFNKLKALPEAVGTLGHLRHLSVHLNCLKSLPTTMAAMTSLMELDVHFNQLESVPESLCLVTTLTKLNVGSNFTDLKELPQSIGRLLKLKELDASYNHLTVLPDSFAMLTNLQELRLEGNPLRVPPLHIVEQKKEAVLQYMSEYVTQKENKQNKIKKKGKLALICSATFKLFKARRKLSSVVMLDIKA